MKQYDESKYRALGVGERVKDGDLLLIPPDEDEPQGRVCLVHDSIHGCVVDDTLEVTYLRPIEQEAAPAPVAKQRKATPVTTGVLDYFPDAIRAVSQCSYVGNEQHNPGKPMHWDRSKSADEADSLVRHLMERGTIDTDGVRHTTKVAWRALALLQKELEAAK